MCHGEATMRAAAEWQLDRWLKLCTVSYLELACSYLPTSTFFPMGNLESVSSERRQCHCVIFRVRVMQRVWTVYM